MKYSKLFGKTLRQKPKQVEAKSHEFLLRAGFIKPVAAGIYSFLPLGFKVLQNIDRIINEEFSKRGVQQVLMPLVHPSTLWKETGRRAKMDKVLATFRAKHGGEYLLAPTHEETVTDLARNFVFSYRDLPVILNQNQWKYRDEIRVSGGLLRTREFLMQDAYSFDIDEAGLAKSFELISEAYREILRRMGFEATVVKADSGAIGGSGSEEFMVLSDVGEDLIFVCDKCDYKANIEKAQSIFPDFRQQDEEMKPMEEVEGKNIIGVEALAKHLQIEVERTTKTLLFQADDQVVAVCIRGEYDVSEIKLANLLGCVNLELASAETVKKLTGAEVGYAGPIGLPERVRVIWDKTCEDRVNFECGANETNYHNINVNFDREVKRPEEFVDIRNVKAGEVCVNCKKGQLKQQRTIELAHVFKLGTIYSEPMGAVFLDQKGAKKPMVMGCYGLGMTRVLAAAVEMHHDDKGIIWPEELAPFQVHLINLKTDGSDVYERLVKAGVEVLWDDREESAGVKFADADLIGIPIRLVVSAKTGDKIEIKRRGEEKTELVDIDTVIASCKGDKA